MKTGVLRKDKAVPLLLALVLVLALGLRLPNVGHVLSWDEAWNVNSIEDAVSGHHDDVSTFYPNIFRHPPAYTGLGMLFARVTGSGRVGLSIFLEIVSIVFALLLIVMIFMCGRDWLGKWAGLTGAMLFALMPAARVYDTWIKQESMTLALGMLFLFFFFRKRYLWAGLFLGLAFLTKEIAVFLPVSVLIFVLITRRTDRIKGLGASFLVAVPLCAWWFLLLSRTKGQFLQFFLGTHVSAQVWHEPFYFYLARIPADVGWGVLLAVLAAAVALAWRPAGTRVREEGPTGYSGLAMLLFLMVWIVVVYLVLSLSHGKPPWMIYGSLPAFALIGGWGFAALISGLASARAGRLVPVAAAAVLVAATAALQVPFGFESYMRSEALYTGALNSKAVAGYINAHEGALATVMLQDKDNSPELMFYLDCYRSGQMSLLPKGHAAWEGEGKRVLLLSDDVGADDVLGHVARTRPDVLLIGRDSALASDISKLDKPERVGGMLLYDGGKLYEAVKRRDRGG